MYIDKPNVPHTLFYGEVISWKTPATLKKLRGKYCITIELTFSLGKTITKQYGSCDKAEDARSEIDIIAGKLYTKTFVPFKYTCKDYLRYWLYWYKAESGISYNTYYSYRNCVENYIIPEIGDRKINSLKSSDIVKMIKDMDLSASKFKQIKGVLYSAFKYARSHNIVEVDPVPPAMRILNSSFKQSYDPEKEIEVYSPQQLHLLLESARKYENVFIPCLLSACAGLRISESLAVRKEDIDFEKGILHVRHQLGNKMVGDNERFILKSPKTLHSIRSIPLSEEVLKEIVLAIQRNDNYFKTHPSLVDYGFLTINAEGLPCNRTNIYRLYNKAINDAGLPVLKFHRLRHSYATIINKYGDFKMVAETMGHNSYRTTKEIYVYKEKNITDTSDIINEFCMSIGLKEKSEIGQEIVYDCSEETSAFVSEYLNNTCLPKASK